MTTRPGWRSLNRKLPLLISALVLLTVVSFSWTAYRRFENVLLSSAGERLLGVSRTLEVLLSAGATQRRALTATAAARPDLAEFLATGTAREGAAAVLAGLLPTSKRERARAQLRDLTGRVVLETANDSVPSASAWLDSVTAAGGPLAGKARQGPLMALGSAAFVLGVAPIAADGRVVGYLTEIRQTTGTNVQMVRELMGANIVMIVGVPGTPVWTDLERVVPAPPPETAAGKAVAFDSSAYGPGVGAATQIRGTPLVLWLHQPRATLLAPTRRLLIDMGLLAAVFVIGGTLLGWLASRRVTRPLAELTEAAERLDSGADSLPRREKGDEIERLGDAFGRMSARVNETHGQLEARVSERTKRLETALKDLAHAQEQLVEKERLALLGQLAGAVGHELRNPLGVISNALYVLNHVLADAPALAHEYLELIRGQIVVSERIIGDLLDTARVRPPQLEPVRLSDLVQSQVRRLGVMRGVDVRVEIPLELPFVSIDPVQLTQVFLNLLTNAVQAMGDNGGVLRIEVQETEEGRIRVEIQDSGPGIAPELHERIFEPLYTTKARGLGLGLWVSRALATANEVDLTVHSRPGEGTTFRLEMQPATVAAVAMV